MNIPFASEIEHVTAIRTGTLIDSLSGIGGFPRGRISEVFGDEAVGKSTILMQAIAHAQEQGLKCLLADTEYSYTLPYGEALGIDNEALGLIRAQFAEDVLDTILEAIESKEYDLIVLDSIGGLHTRAEAEKTTGEKTIGGQAGIVAKFCRKAVPLLSMNQVALVVINHSFTDLMSGAIMTSGGRKLGYHKKLSIRLKTNKLKAVMQNGVRVGKVIVGEVKKNALAPTEGRIEEATLLFGTGFSAEAKLLDEGLDRGIIRKEANTYFIGETRLGVGLTKARKAIEDNPVIQEQLKEILNGTKP